MMATLSRRALGAGGTALVPTLRIAEALGLTIPQSLLRRADYVLP